MVAHYAPIGKFRAREVVRKTEDSGYDYQKLAEEALDSVHAALQHLLALVHGATHEVLADVLLHFLLDVLGHLLELLCT